MLFLKVNFILLLKQDLIRKRIHFHGNNKTKREIQYALDNQIGYFVVDTLEEIDLIDKYADDSNVDVVLRVNPGVEAHT